MKQDLEMWDKVADKIINKERIVAGRNRGKIPYTTVSPHVFDDWSSKEKVSWWTNGFWGGMMWQLYHATGEELFLENARDTEDKLDLVFMNYNGMDHDGGFRWLPTAVADYRLTGNEQSRNRALIAANALAGRFNPNGRFIRAWNDWGDGRDTRGWAIIDCMMNLALLYFASEELKDPRFKAIAVAHADTVSKHFIREDGSVRHIVGFDPETGEYLRDYGGQGMGEGSSWTRGQTWALYGFALSYLHTGEERFLTTACKVADRFIERIPENGLIPVDFDQPAEVTWRDDTAAAIAACGLLTLAGLFSGHSETSELQDPAADQIGGALSSAVILRERSDRRILFPSQSERSDRRILSPSQSERSDRRILPLSLAPDIAEERGSKYRTAAIKLLEALNRESCDYDPEHDELLTCCTAAYHDEEHEFPIIYGDYYYIEAVWKLTGKELFIW